MYLYRKNDYFYQNTLGIKLKDNDANDGSP
jgi:hypothetical protein